MRSKIILPVLILIMMPAAKSAMAQDEQTEGEKYHIILEKDENGKKTRLDTVVTADTPFVWEGDTNRPGSRGDSGMARYFEFKTDDDGKVNLFVLKEQEEMLDSLRESLEDMQKEINENIMIFKYPMDEGAMEWHSDRPQKWHFDHDFTFPEKGEVFYFGDGQQHKNIIDLSDPGIISYKKKTMKDGTEKITIVRKKKASHEKSKKIVIKKSGTPVPVSVPDAGIEVVVIDKEGRITVNGEEMEVGDADGERVIRLDGKVIRIRKPGNGGKEQIEVEVEEEHKSPDDE